MSDILIWYVLVIGAGIQAPVFWGGMAGYLLGNVTELAFARKTFFGGPNTHVLRHFSCE